MLSKLENEITYPFPNFNGFTIEVWEWMISSIPTLYYACDYFHAGIKIKLC